jgi:hypothetical protein
VTSSSVLAEEEAEDDDTGMTTFGSTAGSVLVEDDDTGMTILDGTDSALVGDDDTGMTILVAIGGEGRHMDMMTGMRRLS